MYPIESKSTFYVIYLYGYIAERADRISQVDQLARIVFIVVNSINLIRIQNQSKTEMDGQDEIRRRWVTIGTQIGFFRKGEQNSLA
jgi:hypothetical protein